MGKLDEFASVFKSASKRTYVHTPIETARVLVVTDLEPEPARLFAEDVQTFLAAVQQDREVQWLQARAAPQQDVGDLLAGIEQTRPDLVCCYRNLQSHARNYPFSLGAHVDVLTQAITTPVLLLPRPDEDGRMPPVCRQTDTVMVLADDLTGSDRLIDYGVHFCRVDGRLVLVHLEDDAVFRRYLGVIAKIPAIDTDVARERIAEQLLKEPGDYIRSAREVLETQRRDLSVDKLVGMGHRVGDCRAIVQSEQVDLVVMNTKDDEQLAMHGLAYPIAIELRDVPLLML